MIRHPLGVGAELGQDYKTEDNRNALAACLKLYYSQSLTERINSAREQGSRIGLPLANKFVSSLEIANALDRLGEQRPSLLLQVQLIFKVGWTRLQLAQRLHVGTKTIRENINEALDIMIACIWLDEN